MRKVTLIGAGGMAVDYAAVLNAMGLKFEVICRSQDSANAFRDRLGQICISGGITKYLASGNVPSHVIVSVGVDSLFGVTEELLLKGVKNILIEKPAALFATEIDQLEVLSKTKGANVFVAYNRRFYASVQKLKEMAYADGGIKSLHFDFTEWSDSIATLEKGENVKERWVLSNSTHIIDLAFYLAGKPVVMNSTIAGSLVWHPNASRFSGHGLTDQGVVFSYRADWDAPGRWGVTAYSKNFKFDLCPIETLNAAKRNTNDLVPVNIDDCVDLNFKPGLFEQVSAFFKSPAESPLCKLSEHQKLFRSYLKIAGYADKIF